jgi:hypothetical protein
VQQDGALSRLPDGSIVMVFAHKDNGYGQRAIFSYDEGLTWSTNVFEIHKGGLYAQSVVVANGKIITATAVYPGDAGDPDRHTTEPILHSLIWEPPSRKVVSTGGFMRPLIPPQMYTEDGDNLLLQDCTLT